MLRKARFRTVLISMSVLLLGCNQGQQMMARGFQSEFFKFLRTDPDKNLLIGEWSATGTPYYFKISGLNDIGRIDVAFYNPNNPYKIEIEKANWAKISTLLSIYIELQHPEFPGSNFKLNYIPERDVLVGVYFDSMTGLSYPLEFVRIQ